MAPFLVALAKAGLPTLVNAILSVGKEVVEKELGVDITSMLGSEEGKLKLKELELKHEEFLITAAQKAAEVQIEAEKHANTQVSERWKFDMMSDSYLSKNIRPMTLIFILFVYTLFGLMSAFGLHVNASYVELLGQWGIIIMSAYFVGRTFEKIKQQ